MDYPVMQAEGVEEGSDFSQTGLPRGVRAVRFTSTGNPVAKRSVHKLAQLCTLLLLRTPGQDVLAPDLGGGLRVYAARPVNEGSLATRQGEMRSAVADTERQMLAQQAELDLPSEERLRSFTLVSANYEFSAQEWRLVVRVVSEAGGAAEVLL